MDLGYVNPLKNLYTAGGFLSYSFNPVNGYNGRNKAQGEMGALNRQIDAVTMKTRPIA